MLEGFSAFIQVLKRHRLVVAAAVVSALLHGLLLWPGLRWPHTEHQQPVPVIQAELRSETPAQPELRDGAAGSLSGQPVTQPAKPPAQPQPARNLTSPQRPVPDNNHLLTDRTDTTQHSVNSPDHAAQDGLQFSKETDASNPLESTYQQQLLAHLQKKLRVPDNLSGKVRLEIHFSYRQIATEIRVLDSSNNPAFDDWAQKAVMSANPFPPVPAELPPDYIFRPTIRTEE